MANESKKISEFPQYYLSEYLSEGVDLLVNVNINSGDPSTGLLNSNEMFSTYLGSGIDPHGYYPKLDEYISTYLGSTLDPQGSYPSLEAYISLHSEGGGGFDPTDLPTWSVSAVTYLAIATDEEYGGLGKVPIESYITYNMHYRYIPSIYYNMRNPDYCISDEDLNEDTTFVINNYDNQSSGYLPYTLSLGTLMSYIREHL